MFFLSKVIFILLNPLVWIVGFSIFALFTKKRWLVYISVLLLYVFSLSYPIDSILATWEFPPRPIPAPFSEIINKTSSQNSSAEQVDKVDRIPRVAIVLGGILYDQPAKKNSSDPRLYTKPIDMGQSTERFFETLELYQTGHVEHIIISGGAVSMNEEFSESVILGQIARNLGIPSNSLTLETTSRNTHENAKNTAEIIKERFPDSPLLLVTSAFHMERAYRSFRKENIFPEVYPVDFRSEFFIREEKGLFNDSDPFTIKVAKVIKALEPNSEAIDKWHIFLKEIIGVLGYTVFGYI